MDIRKVKKLIKLLEESSVSEIEVKEGEASVRISRHPQQGIVVQRSEQASPLLPSPALTVSTSSLKTLEEPPTHSAISQPVGSTENVIRSPMVGTFYRAPSPDAKPFVEVGQGIKSGDTLCIIEAMKMFNPIESDRNGTVSAILAENGQPVEYDQPLFVIA